MGMDEDKRRWHIGKEIPVATIIVLLCQTVAVIWWAASISAKVEANEKAAAVQQLAQATVDRRQDDEALRSEARLTLQLDRLNTKLDKIIEGRR